MDTASENKSKYYALLFTFSFHALLFLLFVLVVLVTLFIGIYIPNEVEQI